MRLRLLLNKVGLGLDAGSKWICQLILRVEACTIQEQLSKRCICMFLIFETFNSDVPINYKKQH